jgi:hypothetical protein
VLLLTLVFRVCEEFDWKYNFFWNAASRGKPCSVIGVRMLEKYEASFGLLDLEQVPSFILIRVEFKPSGKKISYPWN